MNAELSISLGSAGVALGALFLSVYQAYLSRKHNRLSVVPELSLNAHFSNINPRFTAQIENAGIGPAIIKSFTVFVDGNEDQLFEAASWLPIVDNLGLKGHVRGSHLTEGTFVQAGKVIPLVSFEADDLDLQIRTVRQAFQRIRILIKYASVYGEPKEMEFKLGTSIFDCYETGMKDL